MAARRPARSTTSKSTSSPTSRPFSASAPAPAPAPVATFAELGVPRQLTDLLAADGITEPFPIQAATLPDSMAGRDVLGRGRTGSGKTLGFLLPVLTRLAANPRKRRPNHPRALVLAPTRELATQIHAAAEPLAKALGLRTATIFGGVAARPQISALRGGLDLVIACPGRLLDHLEAGHANLSAIEVTVLDEADHMADLGFLPMVKRILDATPAATQRLLFSATLDNGIDHLARRYLDNPVTHSVDSAHTEIPTMAHHVLHIDAAHRVPILVELTSAPGRTIVFTRTKHGARKLTRQLLAAGIPAVDLHGNLAQNARTRNLAAFTAGQATTLVATDIAARGIHVDEVALVVHADPPVEHKAYLHRSGRTARAGNSGTVITLMTDTQVAEVRELTRKARITATTTRLAPGNPMIETLAPGTRSLAEPALIATLTSKEDPRQTGSPAATPRGGTGAPRRRRPRGPATGQEPRATSGSTTKAKTGGGRGGRGGSGGGAGGGGVAESTLGASRNGTGRNAAASSSVPSRANSRTKRSGGKASSPSSNTPTARTGSGGAAKAQNVRGRGR
ncbi:MAG TPA: DEAD/DEAH box helicase [Actinocrinis sp.]|jgi:superfamily II DNA/RNA helicase